MSSSLIILVVIAGLVFWGITIYNGLGIPVEVSIDFAQLRAMPDSALGILASGLADRPNVKLVGLPRHAERILRAFGVSRVA